MSKLNENLSNKQLSAHETKAECSEYSVKLDNKENRDGRLDEQTCLQASEQLNSSFHDSWSNF
jgi:hypothetical protein